MNFNYYVASWFTCVAVIWKLFVFIEDTTTSKVKREVSKWLNSKHPNIDTIGWTSKFPDIFDSVFGKKHFSFHCFFKSSIASMFIVIVFALGWCAFSPKELVRFLSAYRDKTFLMMLYGILFYNIIADYFSLLETRYIITLMSQTKSIIKICSLLFIDFIASIFIFSFFLSLNSVTLLMFVKLPPLVPPEAGKLYMLLENSYDNFIYILQGGVLLFNDFRPLPYPPIGIFVYSSLFTSIWIWIYFVSISLLKMNKYLIRSLMFFKRFLDIDNKPFRSIGAFAIVIISAIYLLLIPITKLFY